MELLDALDFARPNAGPSWSPSAGTAAMVTERRAVVRLIPDRAYGMLSLPGRAEPAEQE